MPQTRTIEDGGLSQVITSGSESENWKNAFSFITLRTDLCKLPSRLDTGAGVSAISKHPVSEATAASAPALAPAPGKQFTWTVLWDIENVCIPSEHNGAQIVHAIGKSLQKLRNGVVRRIVAFVDINKLRLVHRNELQSHGVLLMHVETAGRKDAADKALIVELMLTALDVPLPTGIALLSGDQDYAYPIAILRQRGFSTVVIAPYRSASSPLLTSVPEFVLSFKGDVLRDVPEIKRPKPKQRNNTRFGGAPGLPRISNLQSKGGGGAGNGGGSGGANSNLKRHSFAWMFFKDHRVQVLVMILAAFSAVHLISALANGVFDVIRSATLYMVIRECIHSVSPWQILTHVVVAFVLFGTLKILSSTGAKFKGLVLLRHRRNYHNYRRKRRPTTLRNPPNL